MKTRGWVQRRGTKGGPSGSPAGGGALRRAGWLTLALLLLTVAGGSGPAGADVDLPAAEEILDRAIEALGGRESLAALSNSYSTGTMEMPQMGLKGTTVSYAAAPAKLYQAMEAEGLGTVASGGDGEVYWELSMITGPKIKEGEELAVARREAMFHGQLKWRELYTEVKTTGVDTIDGTACYRVELTPVEGRPEVHEYAIDSGLLVKSAIKLKTDMGIIPIETQFKDYRETDGVLSPHRIRQLIMGMQEMLFTTDSIRYNIEIPDSVFALPPEVEALLAKQQHLEEATGLEGKPKAESGEKAGEDAPPDGGPAEEPEEPIELQ